MAGYTYTTLRQAILDYTDNEGEAVFENNIDNFIRTAEERILKEAQLEVFRNNATATTSRGLKYLPKPEDWLFSYSLLIEIFGQREFLLQKDFTFIQDYAPDDTAEGEPRYYADYDLNNFIIAPTPDGQYSVELNYFYRPISIVETSNGETWLGTNAGPAMLYGSLVEAYIFMKGEPDMIQSYDRQFNEAIAKLTRFADLAEGRDMLRQGSD